MQAILNAIKYTPWWVYLFFFYVLYVGIKALKPRTVSINKTFILPIIFLIWSIWNLIARFQEWVDLFNWGIFIVIGSIAGWGIMYRVKIQADHKKLLIRLPGTPVTLILILAIFSVKYFFGYMQATNSQVNPMLHSLDIAASSLFTGLFIGRSFATIKKFMKAKPQKLKRQ